MTSYNSFTALGILGNKGNSFVNKLLEFPPSLPVFSLSVFSLSVFSLSVFSLPVFSLSVFSLSVFSLSVFPLSVFSLSVFSVTRRSQREYHGYMTNTRS